MDNNEDSLQHAEDSQEPHEDPVDLPDGDDMEQSRTLQEGEELPHPKELE